MFGITTSPANGATLGKGASVAASPPPDLKTLARTGDVDAIALHIQAHPADRKAIEHEMVKASRTGDLSRVAQTLKYELPHWTTSPYGDGPTFTLRAQSDPTNAVGSSPAWPGLVQAGTVTPSEQRVIGRMAANEGKLDSVQAYDSETVSVGAMQKTVNASGTGELAKQVYDFSQVDPAKYKALFTDTGWSVAHTGKGTTADDYTMTFSPDGTPKTPAETRAYIKDRSAPDHWNAALVPLLQAGRDPAFQAQQIGDFKRRLDTAIAVVPTGTAYKAVKGGTPYTRPISDYLTSEQGAALVLDQSVNRPSRVASSFGKALDTFYAANPKAPADPAQWTADQRVEYEPKIMSAYQAQREASKMTAPIERYDRIVGQGSTLSAAPGSFVGTR
ncbi:hypothetical protein U1872_03745 [Sphingomonas sp. RB3P16]|uniref:hypothetical protein n=1 Tax=Parasphingomonas frigoris TaxID=3096163 RepID=UPI002FC9B71B